MDKLTVGFFPGSSRAEAGAEPDGPCSSLEEEEGGDDAEGESEAGADDERGEGAVPLRSGGLAL